MTCSALSTIAGAVLLAVVVGIIGTISFVYAVARVCYAQRERTRAARAYAAALAVANRGT